MALNHGIQHYFHMDCYMDRSKQVLPWVIVALEGYSVFLSYPIGTTILEHDAVLNFEV